MTAIPPSDDALLTRAQTAIALTEMGFPVKAKTLATKATRGGGPPFHKFGSRVLYRWRDALQWAATLLRPPRANTSELDAASGTAAHFVKPGAPTGPLKAINAQPQPE